MRDMHTAITRQKPGEYRLYAARCRLPPHSLRLVRHDRPFLAGMNLDSSTFFPEVRDRKQFR